MRLPPAGNRDEAIENYLLNEAPCASKVYEQDINLLRELGGQMYDRDYDPDGIQRQTDAMYTISLDGRYVGTHRRSWGAGLTITDLAR